jgi:hypothetical protein
MRAGERSGASRAPTDSSKRPIEAGHRRECRAPRKKSAVSKRSLSDRECEKKRDFSLKLRITRDVAHQCATSAVAVALGLGVWVYPDALTPVAVALVAQSSLLRARRPF